MIVIRPCEKEHEVLHYYSELLGIVVRREYNVTTKFGSHYVLRERALLILKIVRIF